MQQSRSRETYVNAATLRAEMGGVSHMWIWRRLRGEVDDGVPFPKPVKLGNRNFWLRSELEAYKAALTAARHGEPTCARS